MGIEDRLGVGVSVPTRGLDGVRDGLRLGGFRQPLDFKADIYGVFVQGSYRFGPF